MTNDKIENLESSRLKTILKDVQKEFPQIDIVYLTEFGSHLFSTATEQSDKDYKAIFIPDYENLLVNEATHHIRRSTSKKHEKNTNEDIDLDLWSVHKLFQSLKKGDVNAMDIVYSMNNEDTNIISPPIYLKSTLLNNSKDLFSRRTIYRSCMGYLHGQLTKYRNKKIKYLILEKLIDTLEEYDEKDRLDTAVFDLLQRFGEKVEELDKEYGLKQKEKVKSFLRVKKEVNKNDSILKYLILFNNKKYQVTKHIREVLYSMKKIKDNYGQRVKNRMDSVSDVKAISHALRVYYEAKELIETGQITFPVDKNRLLKDIKAGKLSQEKIDCILEDLEDDLDNLTEQLDNSSFNKNINGNRLDELLLYIVKAHYSLDKNKNII